MCVCDSMQTNMVIQGLKPYTFFRFVIRSNAGSLMGPFSDEIRCRTAEGRKYSHHVLYFQ